MTLKPVTAVLKAAATIFFLSWSPQITHLARSQGNRPQIFLPSLEIELARNQKNDKTAQKKIENRSERSEEEDIQSRELKYAYSWSAGLSASTQS